MPDVQTLKIIVKLDGESVEKVKKQVAELQELATIKPKIEVKQDG